MSQASVHTAFHSANNSQFAFDGFPGDDDNGRYSDPATAVAVAVYALNPDEVSRPGSRIPPIVTRYTERVVVEAVAA